MKITTKDIAKLAGVSRGTVDRALNNRGDIAPEVKAKILEIANRHGYVKNHLASSLAKNQKKNIAILLPNPKEDIFWEASLIGIQNLEDFVGNYGLKLKYTFFSLFNSTSFSKAIEKVIEDKPDAILTAPIYYKESIRNYKLANQNNIPIVCINSEILQIDTLTYIGQNSYDCGIIAAKLFDISLADNQAILSLTIGHKADNAVHIKKKLEGLQDYLNANRPSTSVYECCIEELDNPALIAQTVASFKDIEQEIGGIFFTNSRAYHFNKFSSLFNSYESAIKIGFDLIPPNIELLKDKKLHYLLNQNPQKQGHLGLMALFNHFIYQKQILPKRYLPVDIVVAENYSQYLNEEVYSLELQF